MEEFLSSLVTNSQKLFPIACLCKYQCDLLDLELLLKEQRIRLE